MLVATGSIKKFCGITGFTRTTKRSRVSTPTAVIAPSITGRVAGAISFISSMTNSAMPVPKTAELIRASATPLRTLVRAKSSVSCLRKNVMSCRSSSCRSSLMSKKEPRPNVASSISATEDSTACCRAGEIILERSDCLKESL